jgi:hypothetical protein
MTTNTMQKATLAMAATALVLVVVGYFAVAPQVAAQTPTTTTTTSTALQQRMSGLGMMNGRALGRAGGMFGVQGAIQSQLNIVVGQTFTITSTSGNYYLAGTPSTNGTASGTLTFTVTGKLSEGYTLSLTSGSLTVAGTTYSVTSGSAQMGPDAGTIVGQGATNPTGTFLIRAGAHGSFVGTTGVVGLDLQAGSSEYLVVLTGTISS